MGIGLLGKLNFLFICKEKTQLTKGKQQITSNGYCPGISYLLIAPTLKGKAPFQVFLNSDTNLRTPGFLRLEPISLPFEILIPIKVPTEAGGHHCDSFQSDLEHKTAALTGESFHRLQHRLWDLGLPGGERHEYSGYEHEHSRPPRRFQFDYEPPRPWYSIHKPQRPWNEIWEPYCMDSIKHYTLPSCEDSDKLIAHQSEESSHMNDVRS